MYTPDYHPQRWHQFLIYIGYTITAFLINAFMNDLLPYINKGAITWSIAGFIVISITVLACASPHYASGDFVFRSFINETGWPDGIAWLLGLLQGVWTLYRLANRNMAHISFRWPWIDRLRRGRAYD